MQRTVKQWAFRTAIALSVVLGAVDSLSAQSLTWLGTLGGQNSLAYGVSDNGAVAGWAWNTNSRYRAFRWTALDNRLRDLGALSGTDSEALGISADGSVVVGAAYNGSGYLRAFRWTASNNQMQDLGTLGGSQSVAWGVSANGDVVVGWAQNNNGQRRAFRWTASDNQLQDLGTLGGNESVAYGISANGDVVVGWAQDANNRSRAFRWTAQRQMENLNNIYASLLTNGSVLEVAYAVSSDGRYIAGRGYNAATRRSEAFLLDTWRTGDMNGDGCIDDLDLLAVLHAFDTPGTGYARHEDINKDGIVDDADLLTVLFNFGDGCN